MIPYILSSEDKNKYASMIVLNEIINNGASFNRILGVTDNPLEQILNLMLTKDVLEINNDVYVSTERGKKLLNNFFERYFESLKIFDVFCAVDLNSGNFAFEKFYDFGDDEWKDYLNQERWEDMRVAVAEFKKLDPVEIIFMSFINEGRFDTNQSNWKINLLTDTIWNEILNIVNSNVHIDQVSPDEMINMVKTGSELMLKLIKQEEDNTHQDQKINITTNEVIDEEQYGYDYYSSYYDPYYISPFWDIPFIMLY